MGFVSSLFSPKMPSVPQLEMPKTADVPTADDLARQQAEADALAQRNRNRKGRRSTILTDASMEATLADLNKPTLLGG